MASNPEKGGASSGLGNTLQSAPAPRLLATSAIAIPLELMLDLDSLEARCLGDPDGSLGLRCVDGRLGGVDHVAAGIGLRNTGQGVIGLVGAPQGAELAAALLYVGVIYEGEAPASITASFDGTSIVGELAGVTEQPCWTLLPGELGIYRFDVVDLVRPIVNGFYHLKGVPSALVNGQDPFSDLALPYPQSPVAEGATLVAFFTHESVPESARSYVDEGPWSIGEGVSVSHELDPPPREFSSIRHTRIAADGQRQEDGTPVEQHITTLSGPAGEDVIVRGPGSSIDPRTDFTGADGGPISQLWDTSSQLIGAEDVPFTIGSDSYSVSYQLHDSGGAAGSCQVRPISPASAGLISRSPFDAADPLPVDRLVVGRASSVEQVDCVAVVAHVLSTR